MARKRKLQDRQKKFADEYLIDLNVTQAAIRAGYTENYAHTNASKLLQNPLVAEYIQKRQQDRIERTEITQDMVLKELAIIAFSNATDYVKVVEKEAIVETMDGGQVPVLDKNGNPVMYKTVEPVLTSELTEDQRKALNIIKRGRDGFEVKPYDKVRALELLGKHLGMFTEKVDVSGEIAIPVFGGEDALED